MYCYDLEIVAPVVEETRLRLLRDVARLYTGLAGFKLVPASGIGTFLSRDVLIGSRLSALSVELMDGTWGAYWPGF